VPIMLTIRVSLDSVDWVLERGAFLIPQDIKTCNRMKHLLSTHQNQWHIFRILWNNEADGVSVLPIKITTLSLVVQTGIFRRLVHV